MSNRPLIYYTDVIEAVENIDNYRTGGLHPILLKLGYGCFSSVWLGRVLNVNPTDYHFLGHIRAILHHIDSFIVNGPNGQHNVFVTQVVSPSFATVQSACYDLSIAVGGHKVARGTASMRTTLRTTLKLANPFHWNYPTLADNIADLYPHPDKQDFADFLHLILIIRPEKRADIPTLLSQRWLQ
ncbi:hypothetical protein V8E54_005829 [Elaphomyces granulatus]